MLTTSICYENDGFNYLHRVNGQYNCNSTFKVTTSRQIPTFILEICFDMIIVANLIGLDNIFKNFISSDNGKAAQEQCYSFFVNVVVGFHAFGLFIKFPVVSKMNIYFLTLSLIITFVLSFFEDPDLIGINYL